MYTFLDPLDLILHHLAQNLFEGYAKKIVPGCLFLALIDIVKNRTNINDL